MKEQDKKYVIEALEYALHKCINVNGNAETHYNTLVNAIEVVKKCSIPDVVEQSEKLVICKKCGSSEMYQYTKTKDKCEDCGNIQDY